MQCSQLPQRIQTSQKTSSVSWLLWQGLSSPKFQARIRPSRRRQKSAIFRSVVGRPNISHSSHLSPRFAPRTCAHSCDSFLHEGDIRYKSSANSSRLGPSKSVPNGCCNPFATAYALHQKMPQTSMRSECQSRQVRRGLILEFGRGDCEAAQSLP